MAKGKAPMPSFMTNGNHGTCPICKGDPKRCPHALKDMDNKVIENWVRRIVREEIERALKNQ